MPYGGTANGKRLGLATAPLKWLRAVACVDAQYKRVGNCTPLKADGYAHHPYEFTEAPTAKSFPGADNAPIQTLGRLRTALDKLARAHALSTPKGRALSIYLTESGYFVTGARKVAAAKRARWLPESFQVAAKQARVKEMLQYNVYVPSTSTFTTGLFTLGGSPLPEYKTLLSWTKGAAKKRLIRRNSGPIQLPARPGGTPAPDPERHGHQRGRSRSASARRRQLLGRHRAPRRRAAPRSRAPHRRRAAASRSVRSASLSERQSPAVMRALSSSITATGLGSMPRRTAR